MGTLTRPMLVRKEDTSDADVDAVTEALRCRYLSIAKTETAISKAKETIVSLGGSILNKEGGMWEYSENMGPMRLLHADDLDTARSKWLQSAVFDKSEEDLRKDFHFPASSRQGHTKLTIDADYGDYSVNEELNGYKLDDSKYGEVLFRINPEEDVKIYCAIVNYLTLCVHREKLIAAKRKLFKQQRELFTVAVRPDPSSIHSSNLKTVRQYFQARVARYNSSEHPLCSSRGWTSAGASSAIAITKDTRQIPSSILLGGATEIMPIAVNRKQMKKLQGIIPYEDRAELIVSAGSRKSLIVDAKEYSLPEAEAEDISLHEVSLAYHCNKLDHYEVRDSVINRHLHRNTLPHGVKYKDQVMEFETQYSNTPDIANWTMDNEYVTREYLGMIAPGVAAYSMSSEKGLFTKQVRSIRDDDTGEWEIDTTAQSYINPRNSIGSNRLGGDLQYYKANAYPVQETRYLAKYVGDTDKTIITTGTTPKRALANVRRRIRDEIVDTLGIF